MLGEKRMRYDSDAIKQQLTFQQVFDYVAELGGNPNLDPSGAEVIVSQTICHNPACTGSHKLYYYHNSRLWKCYTECAGDAFDIYDLTRRAMKIQRGEEWPLSRAVGYVARYFGIASSEDENFGDSQQKLHDWDILKNYQQNSSISNDKKIIEFKEFDENILQHLPRPRIIPWLNEGITQEIMDSRGICYDPVNQGIVIPHYDENGALIGIRERTLIKEEEAYGKYRPAILNGIQYNHPLGFALYNLNNSKEHIKQMGIAIVFEGEKSCLKYASMFGADNDISVATCGSNLIQHQVDLLRQYGAREIVIAFDKQFQKPNDAEFKQWTKKLTALHNKYSKLVNISFIFDKKGDMLGYKDAPVDCGAETFMKLFKERVRL